MAQTIRKRILDAIVKKLSRSAYGLKKVWLQEPAAMESGNWDPPCAFVYAEADTPGEGTFPDVFIAKETWAMTINIYVYGMGEIEDYMGKVHKAMKNDIQWAGLAIDTDRLSQGEPVFDSERRLWQADMTYRIVYRHTAGDPFTI